MKPIAEMVQRMLNAGVDKDMVVLAVETAETHAAQLVGDDPVAARRRAYDRERKALSRAMSGGNPVDGFPSRPPKKVSPITPSKNTPLPNPSGIYSREKFSEIVKAFPKRKGRNPLKPALKSYERALSAGTTHEEILAGARRFHAKANEEKIVGTPYVPQLVTWINQEGWADDVPPEPAGPATPTEFSVKLFQNTGRWNHAFGPEPGKPGCRAPAEALQKYGFTCG